MGSNRSTVLHASHLAPSLLGIYKSISVSLGEKIVGQSTGKGERLSQSCGGLHVDGSGIGLNPTTISDCVSAYEPGVNKKERGFAEPGSRGRKLGYRRFYMGRRSKGKRMAGYNARIRRHLIQILWDIAEPLTKQEITTHLKNRCKLVSTPSPISLGTILSRNPQVNSYKSIIITTGDGRRRRVPQYEVNYDLIIEEEDILLTLPFNALTKMEKSQAVLCRGCGRRRYFTEDMERCLECFRFPK